MIPTTTIAFLGQCHTRGYPGVAPDTAFPEVCRNALRSARPGHRIEMTLEEYYHPSQLQPALKRVLPRTPRVVVIEVVGWLASNGSSAIDLSRLPKHLRNPYERVQHLRKASQEVAQQTADGGLVYALQENALATVSRVLRPLLPRLPRPTIEEYESSIASALRLIAGTPGTTAVVQGPGAGNFAMDSKKMAADAVERYKAVQEMARRVAAEEEALFVDRWDTVTASFFIPGSIRPTTRGHSVWGHLLADHLLRAGLV